MVFAPTDEAFAKLPAGTVESLLKPENKLQLQKVLTYHVVQASALSDAINRMIADDGGRHPVPTIAGGKLMSENEHRGNITPTDQNRPTPTVTLPDVRQPNGSTHVHDTDLLTN